jgi:outer membrane protein assembly factor BamB
MMYSGQRIGGFFYVPTEFGEMSTPIKVTPRLCQGSALALLLLFSVRGCGNTINNGNGGNSVPIPVLETWSQFQSGIAGEGFLAVNTELAVPPLLKWEADVGRAGFSSPVIGPDGTVYVGNLDGELVAISPEGTERWRRTFFDNATIMSTPAVAADGSIFVVITNQSDSGPESTLNRVSSNGNLLWSRFAVEQGRVTTSSPRVFGGFVFLYVPAQVAVYDFDGNLVSTGVNVNCGTVCGGSPGFDFLEDLLSTIGGGLLECTVLLPIDSADCWDNFVFEFDGSTTAALPALDPTVAIFTHDEGGPIVVALSATCMTGFRFNAPNLEFLWQRKVYGGGCDDKPVIHGSPANIGGGLLVVADANGDVTAHDPLNGNEFWKYESDDSFYSTPASFFQPIFVASRDSVHLLDTNGKLISKRSLLGRTQASFALSGNRAYIGTSAGLFTFDYEASLNFTVDGAGATYVSTPAIGDDGTVYAATNSGILRAYSPTVGSLQFSFQAVSIGEPADGATLPAGEDTVFSAEVFSPSVEGFDGVVTFSSDIDGDLCVVEGTGSDFSCDGQLISLGQHLITVAAVDASGPLATDSITVEVIEAGMAPAVEILAPEEGAEFGKDEVIAFSGEVNDSSETIPASDITWTSDIDGPLGTGESINTTLSVGAHVITLAAIDSDGLEGEDSVTVVVMPGPGEPMVTILSPVDNTSFSPAQAFTFAGSATDLEDSSIPDSSFEWTSDIDGLLGTGRTLETTLSGEVDPCDTRTHVITLEVTDSDGNTASQEIRVRIRIVC